MTQLLYRLFALKPLDPAPSLKEVAHGGSLLKHVRLVQSTTWDPEVDGALPREHDSTPILLPHLRHGDTCSPLIQAAVSQVRQKRDLQGSAIGVAQARKVKGKMGNLSFDLVDLGVDHGFCGDCEGSHAAAEDAFFDPRKRHRKLQDDNTSVLKQYL